MEEGAGPAGTVFAGGGFGTRRQAVGCLTLEAFKAFQNNALPAAIAAGFGTTAIMRVRFAVIKGADNKDISIGPDIVINLLLAILDRRIDRWRAARRQEIVAGHFDQLKALGTVDEAGKYLLASLVSFQPQRTREEGSGRHDQGQQGAGL